MAVLALSVSVTLAFYCVFYFIFLMLLSIFVQKDKKHLSNVKSTATFNVKYSIVHF